MRLPSDATLIVIDAPSAADPELVELIGAWRAERLPVVHVHGALRRAGAPAAPGDPRAAAAPAADEAAIVVADASAFAGAELEALLAERGVTTIVLAGAPGGGRLEASARDALAHGFQTYVVAPAGRTAGSASPVAVAGETAPTVGAPEAIAAAAAARWRERWKERSGR